MTLNSDPMKSVRMIAVWLLMLALPLQGLAAITSSASCLDADSGHETHSASIDSGNHHAVAPQAHDHPAGFSQHDGDQPADGAGAHACCHHAFSGVPSAAIPGTPAPPHVVAQRVTLLATLHIPELPLRPPQV